MTKSLAINNGYGVLVILHDINHAARYCDQVWLLANGQIKAAGNTGGLFACRND